MNAINLKDVVVGQNVSGLVYVQDYAQVKPAGKAPLHGTLHYKGKGVKLKIWAGATQDFFLSANLTGAVLDITGVVGEYNGLMDVDIKTAKIVEHADLSHFYKSVADVEALFNEFGTYVNSLSPSYVQTLMDFFAKENLYDAFKKTWAGKIMHDAQVGGLLNHTLKMLRIANTMIANDSRLRPHKDFLMLAIMLHDIGKVYEIGDGGAYTVNSFVTHRTLGVEMVSRHKDIFVSNIGEEDFYHLLAVIQGHHGDFGDKPTTIWAYLIHLIDMVDAHTTGFLDKVENQDVREKNGNLTVWSGTDLVYKRA